MYARCLRCCDDRGMVRFRFQASDIVGNGAGKEIGALRHVADMSATFIIRPLIKACVVKTNGPLAKGQTPVIARAKVDLPDALGPMMPITVPRSARNDTF